MENTILRYAVVGIASMGRSHIEGILNCPMTTLAAVCDIREELARTCAADYGLERHYTDLDTISDWALESVTYCTAAKYLAGSNGAFSPKGTATRAMGAKVLMNMTKEAA